MTHSHFKISKIYTQNRKDRTLKWVELSVFFFERVKHKWRCKHGLPLDPWRQNQKPWRLFIRCKTKKNLELGFRCHQDSESTSSLQTTHGTRLCESPKRTEAGLQGSALVPAHHWKPTLMVIHSCHPCPSCEHFTFPFERPKDFGTYLIVMKAKTKCVGSLLTLLRGLLELCMRYHCSPGHWEQFKGEQMRQRHNLEYCTWKLRAFSRLPCSGHSDSSAVSWASVLRALC